LSARSDQRPGGASAAGKRIHHVRHRRRVHRLAQSGRAAGIRTQKRFGQVADVQLRNPGHSMLWPTTFCKLRVLSGRAILSPRPGGDTPAVATGVDPGGLPGRNNLHTSGAHLWNEEFRQRRQHLRSEPSAPLEPTALSRPDNTSLNFPDAPASWSSSDSQKAGKQRLTIFTLSGPFPSRPSQVRISLRARMSLPIPRCHSFRRRLSSRWSAK